MNTFEPLRQVKTKYLFFTGKGGVGKTSVACATAVALADSGKNVLLISTDPASNLQDVFETQLDGKGVKIPAVANLTVANLDPIESAAQYRESVVAPYRGKLPAEAIKNMEEQLSGSCTVEIAAFNEFSNFITDPGLSAGYHHIIFDTAPTGHTLRMLQLPSAWSGFISENTHGASCLGQLSGLEDRKTVYKQAVETLSDGKKTTLMLITRPDSAPILEAARAAQELRQLGVENQLLIVNGVLPYFDDEVSEKLYTKQREALAKMPAELSALPATELPLRAYNIMGVKNIRGFFVDDRREQTTSSIELERIPGLKDVIEDACNSRKRVIFTMGKGGVGKTTVAAAIALGLAKKGARVHLTTTDPAHHLKNVISEQPGISMSHIDEQEVLEEYRQTVLAKARANNLSEEDIAYIEEDLRSPCTQEIAVFRAFADIVERAGEEVVVIDTAPTGHTLLLLDATQSYHREVERTMGDTPRSVKELLPRLRNGDETQVVIVTLAETTPVYEALRLEEDIHRAGIHTKWWVINSSLYGANTTNELLKAKASAEISWINRIARHSKGNFALIGWSGEQVKGESLLKL